MTVTLRSFILWIAFGFSALLLGAAGFGIWAELAGWGEVPVWTSARTTLFWGLSRAAEPVGAWERWGSLVPTGLLALVFGWYFRRQFQRTGSRETFFLALFFFFASGELLRLLTPWLEGARQPFFYSLIVTRSVWFTRWAAAFSLFITGLFSAGLSYQRSGLLLGLSFVGALSLAVSWSFQPGLPDSSLLYAPIDEAAVAFVLAALLLLTLGGHLLALRSGQTLHGAEALGGYALLAAGWQLTWFSGAPWAGWLAWAGAAWLLGRTYREQW